MASASSTGGACLRQRHGAIVVCYPDRSMADQRPGKAHHKRSRAAERHQSHFGLPDAASAMLRALVESADDAIIATDSNGTILSWNGSAQGIFGFVDEEVIGKPMTMLWPVEDNRSVIEAVMRGERIDHFETERVAKDGRVVRVSLSLSPIRHDSGEIVGV